jgi:hypothetical protein
VAIYSFTTVHDPQVFVTHLAMRAGSDPESECSNWVHAYACPSITSGLHTAVHITPVATLTLIQDSYYLNHEILFVIYMIL